MNKKMNHRHKFADCYDMICLFGGLVFFAPVALLVRTQAGVSESEFFLLQALLSCITALGEVPFGHITDKIGYKNLIYMVSKAFTEGFYTKPRIDLELLSEHSEGLICLSACLAGYIPRMLAAGDYDKAKEHALSMRELFGEDGYYLELQDHGIEEQKEVNAGLLRLSRETGIPLVATNDAHYLRRADADTQAVLMCIQTNNKIADGRPFGFETDEFYMKSTEEMEALFGKYEGAIENTQKIADMCNFDFDFSHVYLPRFRPDTGETPEDYLKRLAYEGFEAKKGSAEIVFSEENTEEVYRARIEYELSVILDDPDLAVVTAHLTVIALRI